MSIHQSTWPADAFERLKAAYPRDAHWGRAEEALDKLRRSKATPFIVILQAAHRLGLEGRPPQFIPYCHNWLRGRPWEDDSEPVQLKEPEAEQALLGAILVNNDAFDRVSDFLNAEHFAEEIHRHIFEVTGSLVRAGKIATPITLNTFLGDHDLGGITTSQYLVCLAAGAAKSDKAVSLGRHVVELAERRRRAGEYLAAQDAQPLRSTDLNYNMPQTEADAAGLLSAAVMVGHLTLSDEPACRRTLRAAGIDLDALGDAGFRAAHGVALRMVEDRARRATAFREPRR